MKKQLILLFTLIFTGIFSAAAQDPIYVVNGQVVSDIRNIPPGDIESTEMLPADEQTIARYGTEASNGVILITLRYDTPARFPEADGSFNDYISKQMTIEGYQTPALCSPTLHSLSRFAVPAQECIGHVIQVPLKRMIQTYTHCPCSMS